MGMNHRLMRPTQNIHPEAAAWAARVVANGATVSWSTLLAVSSFCRSISAAGIRDRFYRLNLFCGTGLNACLVPLYRGPSLSGTQYGNTTDTNVGPFVSGDYNETGASGGLQGDSNKYLSTGLQPFASGSAISQYGHLAIWAMQLPSARLSIGGCRKDFGTSAFGNIQLDNTNLMYGGWSTGTPASPATSGSAPVFVAVGRRSDGRDFNSSNGADRSTANSTAALNTTAVSTIFRESTEAGGSAGNAAIRQAGYCIGAEISAAQLLSLYGIWRTFQNALSRGVP